MGHRVDGYPQVISPLRWLLASSAAGLMLVDCPAFGQDAPAGGQISRRVEVTGSSLTGNQVAEALPVTQLKRKDILASGATSLPDLVRKISFLQGGAGESSAVGGETFGFAGISIHNVGEGRTLVLLNGRRLAQFGGQNLTGFAAAFDLNSIPLSAIERIELMTDGASALYGADAIGGVVNIITRTDGSDGDVTTGVSAPRGGATEKRLSASKGIASSDGSANVRLSFGHDERTSLAATDRKFSSTGQVAFSSQGNMYRKQQLSLNAIPANVYDDLFQFVNPALLATGRCAAGSFRVTAPYTDDLGNAFVDDYCGHDFARELQIFPERKRDNFLASGQLQLNGGHTLFADLLVSRSTQVSRIAGAPGDITILAGTPLHNQYLLPLGITGDTVAYSRMSDLGLRTSRDVASFLHLAVGAEGKLGDWDYRGAISHSESKARSYIDGYPGKLAVDQLVANGLYDPFVGPGQQTAAAQTALAGAAYRGYWNGGVSRLDSADLSGTYDFVSRFGLPSQLAVGLNARREQFAARPSLFAQRRLADPVAGTLCDQASPNTCDERFGDAAAILPYSAARTSLGLYGEVLMPLAPTFDAGASLRLDHYSDFGNAVTGKARFKWLPAPSVMVRGSVGTGFHAPTVPQVKATNQSFGVTGGAYACTPELQAVATAQGATCQAGTAQYDVIAGGNPALTPEKSRQASLGVRLEPSKDASFAADFWHVQIGNRIGQLSEQFVFANPGAFPQSWTRNVTGGGTLAFLNNNLNLGKSFATGVDFDFAFKARTSIGDWNSRLTMTHVLREVSQLQKNGPFYSAVGNFAELGTVTFRNQARLVSSLSSGPWVHTLAANLKSGYKDQLTTVDVLDASGNVTGSADIRLHVKSYATLDWQSQWSPDRRWSLTAGMLNVFNRKPPFAVSTSGLDRGSQYGYDDRYYDPRGRTVYANVMFNY